jgi:predicted small lipoprotein YifL
MKLNYRVKIFFLSLGLIACGQTGPLYLSTEITPITISNPSQPTTEKKPLTSPAIVPKETQ